MSAPCECCVLSVIEISATGRSLVQRSPTECDVSLCIVETSKNEEAVGSCGKNRNIRVNNSTMFSRTNNIHYPKPE